MSPWSRLRPTHLLPSLVILSAVISVVYTGLAQEDPFLPEEPDAPARRELTPYPCCLADGTCLMREPNQCVGLGGEPEWDAWSCTPNPCPQPQNTLGVGDASGLPGAAVTVPLDLANANVVKGLQTDITFDPTVVSYVSGTRTPRVGSMSFSATVVGGNRVRVVMFYADTSTLAPGSGPIANLEFSILGSGGTYSHLVPQSSSLSGPNGESWTVTNVAGRIDVTEQLGACCRSDGSCAVRTQAACDGRWLGPETDCDPDPCALPELLVDAIETDPPAPTWAEAVRIRAQIRNMGAVASGPSRCLLTLNGEVAGLQSIPPLAPGAITSTGWLDLGVLPATPHEARACADALGEIPEGNEADNCASLDFTVGSFVLHLPPGLELAAGEEAEIPIFLANQFEVKAVSISFCLPSEILTAQALLLEGTRSEGAAHVQWHAGPCPAAGIIHQYTCPAIAPGDGPIARLIVSVDPTAPAGPVPIEFIDQPPSTNRATLCDGGTVTPLLRPAEVTITRADFVRSDVDGSGEVNISDPVWSLAHQFAAGPMPLCLDSADDDDSGEINISDPIYSLNYQFGQGPAPLPPYPVCGLDPTVDPLDCATFPPCQNEFADGADERADDELFGVDLGTPRVLRDQTWSFPIYLRTAVPLIAFEATMRYAPEAMAFLRLDPAAAWREVDFLSARGFPQNGQVRIGCIPDFALGEATPPGRYHVGWLHFRLQGAPGVHAGSPYTEGGLAVRPGLSSLRVAAGSPIPPGGADAPAITDVPTLALGNPYRPGQAILLRGGTPGAALTASVHDVSGRRVATLYSGYCAAEEIEFVWDGQTVSGNRAGSGAYFVRVQVGGTEVGRRFILIR